MENEECESVTCYLEESKFQLPGTGGIIHQYQGP